MTDIFITFSIPFEAKRIPHGGEGWAFLWSVRNFGSDVSSGAVSLKRFRPIGLILRSGVSANRVVVRPCSAALARLLPRRFATG